MSSIYEAIHSTYLTNVLLIAIRDRQSLLLLVGSIFLALGRWRPSLFQFGPFKSLQMGFILNASLPWLIGSLFGHRILNFATREEDEEEESFVDDGGE